MDFSARASRGGPKCCSLGSCSPSSSLGERGVCATSTHQNEQASLARQQGTPNWVVGRFLWRNPWAARRQDACKAALNLRAAMRALSLLVVVRTAALDGTAVCRRRALLGCASGVTVLAAPRRSRAPQRANQISRHRRDLPAREQHIHTTHRSICTQARRPVRRTSSTSWCVRGGPRNGRTRNARAWTN